MLKRFGEHGRFVAVFYVHISGSKNKEDILFNKNVRFWVGRQGARVLYASTRLSFQLDQYADFIDIYCWSKFYYFQYILRTLLWTGLLEALIKSCCPHFCLCTRRQNKLSSIFQTSSHGSQFSFSFSRCCQAFSYSDQNGYISAQFHYMCW